MQFGSHPPTGDNWISRYGERIHLGDDVGLFMDVKARVVGCDDQGQPIIKRHSGGPRESIDADDIMAVVFCRTPAGPTAHGPQKRQPGSANACPYPGCSEGGEHPMRDFTFATATPLRNQPDQDQDDNGTTDPQPSAPTQDAASTDN